MDIFTYYFRKADQFVDLIWLRIKISFLWWLVFLKKPVTVIKLHWIKILLYLSNLHVYVLMKRTRYWENHILTLTPEFFKRMFVDGQFSYRWATLKVLRETDEYLYCESDMHFYMFLRLKNGLIHNIEMYWFQPSFNPS